MSKLGRIVALAAAGVLASCVTTPTETIEQPDLAALAQPYAARLQAVGVSRIETPGVGGAQFVSVQTPYGYFDIRYREGMAPAPFVLIARGNTAFVRSDSYVPAQLPQYREAIDWVVPEVLRVAPRNEAELRMVQAGSGR
jgi:hypothetical protein